MKVGLISRVMEIDIPYYSEWLEYYDKLGIDSFYIIICDVKNINLKNLLIYYPENKIKSIKYFDVNKSKNANSCLGEKLFNIEDDYILNVDSDEFLYLNNLNIKEFINLYPNYNYFKFNWLMVPSEKDFSNSLKELFNNNKKYFVNQYKSMIKKKDFDDYIISPHDFISKNKRNEFKQFNKFYIIHFSYRGRYDAYLKLKFQFLMDKNNILFNNMINPDKKILEIKDISTRVIVYIGELFNNNINIEINNNIFNNIFNNINSTTNINYLKKIINFTEYNNFSIKIDKLISYNIFNNLKLNFVIKNEIIHYFNNNYKDKKFEL